MKIFVTAEAKQDLDEAWDYLLHEAGTRAPADRLFDEIDRVLDLIATHPGLGRRRSELESGVCSFAHGRYTIFYRVDADEMDVLRVLHQRRDVDEVFSLP